MWMVYLKELKEVIRDKKTMFFMILLPLLIFPVIFGGVVYFTSKATEEAQTKTLTYAVQNAQNTPAIDEALLAESGLERVELPAGQNIKDWVKAENVDFVLEIPDNYNSEPLEGGNIISYRTATAVSSFRGTLKRSYNPLVMNLKLYNPPIMNLAYFL